MIEALLELGLPALGGRHAWADDMCASTRKGLTDGELGQFGWLIGWLVCWFVGWLVGWSVGVATRRRRLTLIPIPEALSSCFFLFVGDVSQNRLYDPPLSLISSILVVITSNEIGFNDVRHMKGIMIGWL